MHFIIYIPLYIDNVANLIFIPKIKNYRLVYLEFVNQLSNSNIFTRFICVYMIRLKYNTLLKYE